MAPIRTDSKEPNRRLRPIRLLVIASTFEGQGLCAPCELVLSSTQARAGLAPASERGMEEIPPDWQEQYRRLVDWVYDLAGRYGDRIQIRVIDPQSPQGLLQSLRHWVRRYPTWLVEGGARIVGWDYEALDRAIERAMEAKGV